MIYHITCVQDNTLGKNHSNPFYISNVNYYEVVNGKWSSQLNKRTLDIHNINERNFSINYLFIRTKQRI